YCLLPTAFCLLPSAYCLLPSAYCLLPSTLAQIFPAVITFAPDPDEIYKEETLIMTRKLLPLLTVLALVVMSAALFAQDNTVTLDGYMIDNACASSHVTDKTFPTWVKTHGTSCATMDSCEKSGYAVYAKDKLYKF